MKKVDPEQKKLGDRLKHFRIKLGYEKVQPFTDKYKISRVLYSNWENGKGNITFKKLMKILKIMNVSLAEFFSEGFE